MTISLSNNVARQSYAVAAGVTQSSFTVSFAFFDAADLNVYVDDVEKTLNTDYTVTGGDGSTGSVSISVTGATGGSTVVITRDIELKRTTDFPPSGPFAVATLNTELDKLVAISADLNDLATRSIVLPDSDATSTLTLPSVDDRKSKYLAFDASGLISMTGGTADVTPISSQMSPVVSATSLQLGRERLFTSLSGNGDDGQAILADGSGGYYWANPSGYRNLIINGDMQVAQRGTTATGSTSGGYLTCDRFKVHINSSGTWTATQSTDAPDGFASSLKINCTSANAVYSSGDVVSFQYRIEGQDLQHLQYGTANAKDMVISFWFKSDDFGGATNTKTVVFQQSDSPQTRIIAKAFTATSTWTRFEFLIPGDTDSDANINNDNGIGLNITWYLSVGTTYNSGTLATSWQDYNANDLAVGVSNDSATTSEFYITGVQLEVGQNATPFEHLPYGQQLSRCQRYYYRIDDGGADYAVFGLGQCHDTNTCRVPIHLPVSMRIIPTPALLDRTNVAADYAVEEAGTRHACTTVPTILTNSSTLNTTYLEFTSTSNFVAGNAGTAMANNPTGGTFQGFNAEL